jgi:hypothetical protein
MLRGKGREPGAPAWLVCSAFFALSPLALLVLVMAARPTPAMGEHRVALNREVMTGLVAARRTTVTWIVAAPFASPDKTAPNLLRDDDSASGHAPRQPDQIPGKLSDHQPKRRAPVTWHFVWMWMHVIVPPLKHACDAGCERVALPIPPSDRSSPRERRSEARSFPQLAMVHGPTGGPTDRPSAQDTAGASAGPWALP